MNEVLRISEGDALVIRLRPILPEDDPTVADRPNPWIEGTVSSIGYLMGEPALAFEDGQIVMLSNAAIVLNLTQDTRVYPES